MSSDKLIEEFTEVLVSEAKPLAGECFREVELEWVHPDDVVSGEGTFLKGNRFVPAGTHAVYASASEETALQEYKYGQAKTYGRFLKPNVPHTTYPLQIEVDRCADLQKHVTNPKFADLIKGVLTPGDHSASHVLGKQLIKKGIQAILYPSVIPGHTGTNIVCILDSAPPPVVEVRNRADIVKLIQKAGAKPLIK